MKMNKLQVFVPLAKSEEQDDGSVMVYGYASTETLDHQGEIVKSDAVKNALGGYMEFANIREMHQPSAVGVAKSAEMDDVGLYLAAKIVDPVAVTKVKEGVYKGFSIGGKATERIGKTITAMRMTEISLVDRPANPDALIEVWKMDGEPGDEDDEAPFNEEDLKKWAGENISDAAEAIRALGSIFWLLQKEQAEAGEPPEQITALTAVVENLKAFIASEITEPEHTEKADTDADIAKAGARFSKGTKAALADIHGMMKKCDEALTKMGYDTAAEDEDSAEKGEGTSSIATNLDADAIQKVADGQASTLADIAKALNMAEGEQYTDAIAKMVADLSAAQARVKELEALPEPAKGNVMAVEKADDGKTIEPGPVDQLAKVLEDAKPEDVAMAVMKHIHSQGARPAV